MFVRHVARLALQVNLIPLQSGDVFLAQLCRERKQHDVVLVVRQLGKQGENLLWRNPAQAPPWHALLSIPTPMNRIADPMADHRTRVEPNELTGRNKTFLNCSYNLRNTL